MKPVSDFSSSESDFLDSHAEVEREFLEADMAFSNALGLLLCDARIPSVSRETRKLLKRILGEMSAEVESAQQKLEEISHRPLWKERKGEGQSG